MFFLRMSAFKTQLDLIDKFKWIGTMTFNVIKKDVVDTLM